MTGNRYFAEAMRGYGVTHLFYVNAIVVAAMKEMDTVGVKRVVTHGEKAAAYMADGYARASRRPGVCLAQDIGSTNLAAGLRDAHMASSPFHAAMWTAQMMRMKAGQNYLRCGGSLGWCFPVPDDF